MGRRRRVQRGAVPLEEQSDAVEALHDKNTASSTKNGYNLKMRVVIGWYTSNHPDQVDSEGGLKLPLTTDSLFQFVASLAYAGQLRDQLAGPHELTDQHPEPYSVSYLQGFKSAVLDYYRRKKVTFDPTVNVQWGELNTGCSHSSCFPHIY
jgi:hypothetical protein